MRGILAFLMLSGCVTYHRVTEDGEVATTTTAYGAVAAMDAQTRADAVDKGVSNGTPVSVSSTMTSGGRKTSSQAIAVGGASPTIVYDGSGGPSDLLRPSPCDAIALPNSEDRTYLAALGERAVCERERYKRAYGMIPGGPPVEVLLPTVVPSASAVRPPAVCPKDRAPKNQPEIDACQDAKLDGHDQDIRAIVNAVGVDQPK